MKSTEVLESKMINRKAIASLILGILSVVIPSLTLASLVIMNIPIARALFIAIVILRIASIIIPLALLIISITGITLSKKAKKEIAKTNDNGATLAIWGLYLSTLGIVIQFIIGINLLNIFGLI